MKRNSCTNLFNGGLVMDMNPLITPSNVLTDCLNGTIITNNGNENVLLNDMGNGRVDTAFLPEGYIPVGTCEFGDIIYVASYNPFINKCLLGCFPSPLRLIDSELYDDLPKLSILAADFLDIDKDGNLTGRISATSVKKIIYANNMLSGDKYIIYALNLKDLGKYLSDYGNTDYIKGEFPKLFKITVISVEEDGKFRELTDGLKWYDNYYLANKLNGLNYETAKNDIDSKRENQVNSPYCIFSSKVSGKLALLIELETITGFSCTWLADKVTEESDSTEYSILFLLNWETNSIYTNPSKVVLLESNLEVLDSKNESVKGLTFPKAWTSAKDNFWYKEISRIYKPETAPSYTDFKGYAEKYTRKYSNIYFETLKDDLSTYYTDSEQSVSISDDIVNNIYQRSIRKEFTKFTIPKLYSSAIYNYSIAPCMPYGVLEQYAVSGSIDFSKIGKKSINLTKWKYYNNESYSTLILGLDAYTEPNHIISGIDLKFYDHDGLSKTINITGKESYNGTLTLLINFTTLSEIVDTEKRDYILPNRLYVAEIIVKYRALDAKGQTIETDTDDPIFYKWFWTTTQFNDYFYLTDDFDLVRMVLNLNGLVEFEAQNNLATVETNHDNTKEENTISWIEQRISNGDIKIKVNAGLLNNYSLFNLSDEGNDLNQITAELYNTSPKIKNVPLLPKIISTGQIPETVNIYPEDSDVTCTMSLNNQTSSTVLKYLDSDYQELTELNCKYFSEGLLSMYNNKGLNTKVDITHKSKYDVVYGFKSTDTKKISSFITDNSEYSYYNLNNGLFTKAVGISLDDPSSHDIRIRFWDLTLGYLNENPFILVAQNKKAESKDSNIINVYLKFSEALPEDGASNLFSNYNFIFPYFYVLMGEGGDLHTALYMENTGNFKNPTTLDLHHAICLVPKVSDLIASKAEAFVKSGSFLGRTGYFYNDTIVLTDPSTEGELYVTDKSNHNSIDSPKSKCVASNTAPVKYGKMVSSLLKNTYYVASGNDLISVKTISDWIYLDENYTEFTLYYVLKLNPNLGSEGSYKNYNQCLLVDITNSDGKRYSYGDYIIAIKEKVKEQVKEKVKDISINDLPVNVIFESYQGTFPLTLRILYKLPKIVDDFNKVPNVITLDDAAKQWITTNVNVDSLNANTLYCWDGSQLLPLSGSVNIPLDNGGSFQISDEFALILGEKDGKMIIKSELRGIGSTYKVRLHKLWGLTDYNKGIKLFK